MDNKKLQSLPCEIVADLLPSYADKVTSETTNSAVLAHLEGCANCRAALDAMRARLTAPAAPDGADAQGVAFLKKTKKKANRKLAVSVFCAAMLCCCVFFSVSVAQHPFTPSVQVFQLSDGRLYFELTVYGAQAGVDAISYRELISADGSLRDIQMGYTWTSAWFSPQKRESKTYCFAPVRIDPRLETIQYSYGKTIYTIWQKGHTVPPAPQKLEDEVKQNSPSPFWNRYGEKRSL